MAGVITASEPSRAGPFTGLSPRCFTKLVSALRCEGADAVRKGRPWSLPLEDRGADTVALMRVEQEADVSVAQPLQEGLAVEGTDACGHQWGHWHSHLAVGP
jgi:hypothetical protein